MAKTVILFTILALGFFCVVFAFDTSPLQDFCVADHTSTVRVDGLPCKDPAKVEANDFFFSGLHLPGNTSNPYGAGLNVVSVSRVPGLNTLGLYMGRLDLKPNGYIPPHYHVRGSEIVTVLEGSLEIGFVTAYPDFKHFNKVLHKGDVFVVPVGLLHYLRHVGPFNTVAIWAINSQNPGITTVTNAVFGAEPPISSEYLSKAFYLDQKIVEQLQARF